MTDQLFTKTNVPLSERLEAIAPSYAVQADGDGSPQSVGDRHNLSPLLRASCWGFEDLVLSLIADGADIAETDTKGETALHKAARFAHLTVAIALLRKGCNVDAMDCLGMTPLHWAALNGNTQMTRLLLLHQADTSIRDNYAGGMTATEMAELMGHESILGIMQKYQWARKE